jgi:hypothetical protein
LVFPPASRKTPRINLIAPAPIAIETARTKPEVVLNIKGGYKSARRPDIAMKNPGGGTYYENVGRTTRSGQPVVRERRALEDLARGTGKQPGYSSIDDVLGDQ